MPSVSVRLATGNIPFTVTKIAKSPAHRNGNRDVCLAPATFRQAMLHECHDFAPANGDFVNPGAFELFRI